MNRNQVRAADHSAKQGQNLAAQASRRITPTAAGRYRGQRKKGNFVTKREVSGGQINVPSNPPQVAYQPWSPIIIVHSGVSGEITITLKDLVTQLKSQVDPTKHCFKDDMIINLKIRSVRAWNLSGRIIALSVEDFSDSDQAIRDTDMLCGLVDTGAGSHVPAVGYELPLTHRNIVLRNGAGESDKTAIIYHIVSGADDAVVIYTSVLWKCDGPSKVSQFQNQMLNAVRSIQQSTSKMSGRTSKSNSSLGKIYSVTKNILSHMPIADDEESPFSDLNCEDAIDDE